MFRTQTTYHNPKTFYLGSLLTFLLEILVKYFNADINLHYSQHFYMCKTMPVWYLATDYNTLGMWPFRDYLNPIHARAWTNPINHLGYLVSVGLTPWSLMNSPNALLKPFDIIFHVVL